MVDMVLFCGIEVVDGEGNEKTLRRVIRTKPSLYYEAGDRTGRLPETIDLDFGGFMDAFNTAAPRRRASSRR